MLDVLRDVNSPYQRLSLSSAILTLFGVWLCHILLVFPFLFYLIIVILVLHFCPHITSPMYSGWFSLLIKFFITYQKKKKNTKSSSLGQYRIVVRLGLGAIANVFQQKQQVANLGTGIILSKTIGGKADYYDLYQTLQKWELCALDTNFYLFFLLLWQTTRDFLSIRIFLFAQTEKI